MATDAEIRAAGLYAVPNRQYLQNEFQLPTEEVVEEEKESFGIPQTQAFTNSGGNNSTGYNFGNTGFQQAVDARQSRLNAPIDTSTFMGKVKDFMNPQSASQIMTDGYQEPRFQPGIIGMMVGKMDNYRNLPQADQAFISQNMGYTGPTIFGENNSGLSKDQFGINTRSAFGNYADFVDKAAKSNMSEEDYKKLTGLNKKRVDFYRAKKKESDALKMREELAKEERDRGIQTLNQRMRDEGVTGANYNQAANIAGGGGGNTAKNAQGQTAREATYDGNKNTGTAQGYSQHYAKGGRAGYFFGGRVNYKTGGRINFRGGGADMGAEDRAQDRADKGYGNTDGVDRSAVGPGSTYQRNVNNQTSTVKNIIDVGSELNYLNNLKNLNLPGIAVGFGVNKFRDFIGKKNKEEDDKLSYNTNSLPTNNYTAKLVGPALAQMRTLEKAKGMEQFGGPFSTEQQEGLNKLQQMDQEETIYSQPIFVGANGGRAMFKNGGLASIL